MFSLSQGPRWHIDLQPWAGPAQSLDEEALRFLRYISTTQVVSDANGFGNDVKDTGCPFLKKDSSLRGWQGPQQLLTGTR